jgi:hypothetical protein
MDPFDSSAATQKISPQLIARRVLMNSVFASLSIANLIGATA